MKKGNLRSLAALLLALALLLTGCSGGVDFEGYVENVMEMVGLSDAPTYVEEPWEPTAFDDMEYIHPDLDAYQAALDACLAAAQGTRFGELVDSIWAYNDAYSAFYTAYALSYIHYCADLTSEYWGDEYDFCEASTATVDAGLDELYHTLAACSFRERLETDEYFGADFFDDYEGDSFWDDTFTAMMEQEADLEARYYDLSTKALDVEYYSETFFNGYGQEMAQLLVELVALRQKIAAYAGYDNYLDFAYDYTYGRDYTPEDADVLMADIQNNLVDLYRIVDNSDVWTLGYSSCSEEKTRKYVEQTAGAVGGVVQEAFESMNELGLCDITYDQKKYDSSFEIFLSDYAEPFVFLNPTGMLGDQLTFAHEFGHFCNDYASDGSSVGIDVAEIFSQGLEYLSLCVGAGNADLEQYKLADGLATTVEQAAYADFEHRIYRLSPEELTLENIRAVYAQVFADYGIGSWRDPRDFVYITHFFTSPLYIISYVVSNDAAFQLYQQEKEASGEGLKLYVDSLDTEQTTFLAFINEAGLESPFTSGHMEAVREILSGIFA